MLSPGCPRSPRGTLRSGPEPRRSHPSLSPTDFTDHGSTEDLVFDEGERGPGEELRPELEGVEQLDLEEKKVAKSVPCAGDGWRLQGAT